MTLRSLGLALLALIGAACSGTETGNPPSARVGFSLLTSNSSVATVNGTTGHVIQALDLSLQSLTTIDCNGHDIASAGSAQIVHLVSGHTSILVPSAQYCGVRLDLAAAGGAPSVHVEGTRSDGVPFTIDDANALSVTLASPSAFTVNPGEPLIVAFDVAAWFGGAFLQDATASGGRVTVDAATNTAALVQFEAQTAAALYRDPNDDGHIDAIDGPAIATSP